MSDLKRKGLLETKGQEHLDAVLTPTLQLLLERVRANSQRGISLKEYPPELCTFATTLQFYSTKAYEFVRKTFLKALPHVATIRKWYSNITCGPGFSSQAFLLLEEKVTAESKQDKQVLVSVMLDEMSLKKQIDYDEKSSSYIGFVDVGTGETDDSLPPATDALALMCVGVNHHFKILLGYFFICGLSGAEKANLVRIALQKIHDTGARALSITCDGPSAHFAMMKGLGANLDPENMRPWFAHPSLSSLRVFTFLDPVHMLKLVRNALASEKILLSPSGLVCWEFINKLYLLQREEGFKAGTKLTKKHLEWEKNKMKCNLAAQTLSNSVAAAIDFCREDLKLPEFQNSKPTTEFIRLFDALFDIFNSRNQFGKQFKAPLREDNQHHWLPLLVEAADYIKSLRRMDGTLIIQSRLKTGFVGFLSGISALQGMFEELVSHGPLSEIQTYKFSQDHLELYFAAVRSKLGANNNPTPKQFTGIFKRLLVHNQIRGFNSNAELVDSTELLTGSAKHFQSGKVDILSSRRSDAELGPITDELGDDPNLSTWVHGLSDFKESVIIYISGYVVRMVQKKIRCEECLASLQESEVSPGKTHQLLHRKKWGCLTIPSEDVIKVCLETEKSLAFLMAQGMDSLLRQKFLSQKISSTTLKRLFSKTD